MKLFQYQNVLHHEIYIYPDGNENPIIFCPFAPEPYDGIIKIIYNGVNHYDALIDAVSQQNQEKYPMFSQDDFI